MYNTTLINTDSYYSPVYLDREESTSGNPHILTCSLCFEDVEFEEDCIESHGGIVCNTCIEHNTYEEPICICSKAVNYEKVLAEIISESNGLYKLIASLDLFNSYHKNGTTIHMSDKYVVITCDSFKMDIFDFQDLQNKALELGLSSIAFTIHSQDNRTVVTFLPIQ